jgi:hypothetical protein
MRWPLTSLVRAVGLVAACALLVLLAACGGSEVAEDERVERPKPCEPRPELCR